MEENRDATAGRVDDVMITAQADRVDDTVITAQTNQCTGDSNNSPLAGDTTEVDTLLAHERERYDCENGAAALDNGLQSSQERHDYANGATATIYDQQSSLYEPDHIAQGSMGAFSGDDSDTIFRPFPEPGIDDASMIACRSLIIQELFPELTEDNELAIKFLCQTIIPSSVIDENDILGLLRFLTEDRKLPVVFLAKLFWEIGRKDVIAKHLCKPYLALKTHAERLEIMERYLDDGAVMMDRKILHCVDPQRLLFRFMLFRFIEQLTEDCLKKFKDFIPSGSRTAEITGCDVPERVFTLLEQDDLFSKDKTEILEQFALEHGSETCMLGVLSSYKENVANLSSAHNTDWVCDGLVDGQVHQEHSQQSAVDFSMVTDGVSQLDIDKKPIKETAPASNVLIKRDGQLTRYKMNAGVRGKFVIFAVEEGKNLDGSQVKRRGTEQDIKKLTTTFEKLRFEVCCHKNPTAAEIRSTIQQYASDSHHQHNCFACCILSHGMREHEEEHILASDAKKVRIEDLTSILEGCKTLIGKPKLFFINTCRINVEESTGKQQRKVKFPSRCVQDPNPSSLQSHRIQPQPSQLHSAVLNKGAHSYAFSLSDESSSNRDVTAPGMASGSDVTAPGVASGSDVTPPGMASGSDVTPPHMANGNATNNGPESFRALNSQAGGFIRSISTDAHTLSGGDTADGSQVTIPAKADFLRAYSTVDGAKSNRDRETGSWYISHLCEALEELYETADLSSILTEVSNRVCTMVNENLSEKERQVPQPSSTLRARIYFNDSV